MDACPEKSLSGCYPILFQVYALENLRWHPQNHFSGCRLNGLMSKNNLFEVMLYIVIYGLLCSVENRISQVRISQGPGVLADER